MESSQTLLRLGHIRASRSDRSISRRLSVLLCDPTGTSSRHVLPVLLLPLPTVLHLRNLRFLLDSKMASVPGEMGMRLRRKILAIPRRVLIHPPRMIRQWRDHDVTVRRANTRATTTTHPPTET